MELHQYLKNVLRWWWLILLCTGIAAGASYYASLQQPRIYQTTTTLMVGQIFQETNPSGQDFSTIENLAESYAQIAVRQPVLQATVESLDLKMPWQALKAQVHVAPIPGTQLLGVTVLNRLPKQAVAIADEIAQQLILQTPTSVQSEEREERSEFVQSQLDDLESRIEKAQLRVEELDQELDTALSARQISDLQKEISGLESLIKDWQQNYTNLLKFFEGGDSPNFLTIIESAQLPTRPVSPNIQLNIILAAMVGFVLAFAAALLLEYIDDTIKSTNDLNAALGLTILGSIGRIKGKDYKDKLVNAHNPFSPLSEAYRMVRTNLQFMSLEQSTKSIMVTSPNPHEGKSITTANLGVIMAQANLKTIIVDADLRRPSMHKIFQVSNLEGLTNLLRLPDRTDISNQLKNTGIENLQVITSGSLPPNPSEMLSSKRMIELLEQLEQMADIVIFDSPPALAVTDAAILGNRVDGVVLVVQAKQTRREATKQVVKILEQVKANMLGTILNHASGGGNYNNYAYYTRSGRELVGQLDQSKWWRLRSKP